MWEHQVLDLDQVRKICFRFFVTIPTVFKVLNAGVCGGFLEFFCTLLKDFCTSDASDSAEIDSVHQFLIHRDLPAESRKKFPQYHDDAQ